MEEEKGGRGIRQQVPCLSRSPTVSFSQSFIAGEVYVRVEGLRPLCRPVRHCLPPIGEMDPDSKILFSKHRLRIYPSRLMSIETLVEMDSLPL